MDVTGTVASTGELSLRGTSPAASALDTAGQVELRRLELQLAVDGPTGMLDYAVTYTPDNVSFGELC